MDLDQAQRFLEAARFEWEGAITRYLHAHTPRTGAVVDAVLAARQVLELAEQELRSAHDHERMGKDYVGPCERCGRSGPRWITDDDLVRALCAACLEEEGSATTGTRRMGWRPGMHWLERWSQDQVVREGEWWHREVRG